MRSFSAVFRLASVPVNFIAEPVGPDPSEKVRLEIVERVIVPKRAETVTSNSSLISAASGSVTLLLSPLAVLNVIGSSSLICWIETGVVTEVGPVVNWSDSNRNRREHLVVVAATIIALVLCGNAYGVASIYIG